jgi:formate dehydrogenase
MNQPTSAPAILASVSLDDLRERIRRKSRLKGRQVDEASLSEVRALVLKNG